MERGTFFMADVFISYSGESAVSLLPQIADALKKRGISCWYAERDMKPGNFAGVIARAIRNCRIFLLILNQEALQSAHVESELTLAFRRIVNYENFMILPFRVEESCDLKTNAVLPYYLKRFQMVDGCPPDAQHIQDLANRAARILRERVPQVGQNSKQRSFKKRVKKAQTLFASPNRRKAGKKRTF